MKFSLGLLVAALAVCYTCAEVPVDREYRYKYNARAFNGIAGDVKQFAGFGMRGDLIIQNQENHYVAKFENLEGGQMNDHVDVDIDEEFPINYGPLDGEAKAANEALIKPVRFTYKKGLIETFEYTPEDPEWSLNIKRALMALFQLNFERVNPVRTSKSNYLKQDDNNRPNFFRVMEEGIGGECETVYDIASHPYHNRPYERVLNVTKTRYHDRCTGRRPIVFQSTHRGYKCDDCKRIDALQVVSTTQYQLHGDEYHHTVEKISNVGKYLFAPFGSQSQTAWSGVNQTIELQSTSPIQEPIAFPAAHLTSESLHYNHTEFETEHDDEHTTKTDLHEHNYYFRSDNYDYKIYKEQVRKNLDYLAKKIDVTHDDEHREDYPDKINQLVKLLGSMSFDELQGVYDEHLNYDYDTSTPELKRRRMIFWDALNIVGTNPAVSFIVHALKQKYLPTRVGPQFFERMAHYVKDHSESLLNHFLEYTEQIDKAGDKRLFQSFWLVFGSLVNHGCQYDHTLINGNHHVRPETCNKYVELVFDHFEKATTTWEKTLYMKVAGNIGLPQMYEHLRPIVTGEEHHPQEVREPALTAFWKVMHEHREEGLAVAVPMFYNRSESVDVRLTAFEMIMSVNPTYEGLQVIGNSLHDEPSQQVASYVYSTFRNFANSTNPCKRLIGQKLRRVLQNIPEYFYGYQYGQRLQLDYFNDKYNFGSEMTLAYVGANDSIIPERIFIEKSFNIMGLNVDYMAVDFRGTGFSRFYDQLFGTDGLFAPKDKNKSILNIVRRLPRSVNTYDKEIEEISNSVHIEDREPNPIHGSLSFWMFNQEYRYYDFDESDIPTYSQNGYFYLPKELPKIFQDGIKLNTHKTVMVADIYYVLPNDMGMPISLSLRLPGYMSLRGNLKLDVQPGFFPEDRDFKKPTNVKLSIDAQAAAHVKTIAHMAIKTPLYYSYGVGVNNDISWNFPLKIDADYDLTEKKLHINYKPTDKEYELAKVKIFPYTYIDKRTNFITPSEESQDGTTSKKQPLLKPIHFEEEPTKKEVSWGQDYFGAGLKYTETNEYPWHSFGTVYKFFGSFFTKKSRTFEPYYYNYNILQRILTARIHMHEYLAFSPQIVPIDLRYHYVPNKQNPTTEFDLTLDFESYLKTATNNPLPPLTAEKTVDSDPTYRKYRAVHADLTAKGKTERKYKLNLSISRDYYEMPRKIVIEYERTPIPNYDPEPFKLCAYASSKLPSYDQWFSFDKDVEKKAEATYNINFGKDCTSGSKIDVKLVVERTDEEKEQDAANTVPHYQECIDSIKRGYNATSVDCWFAHDEYYTLKKYTMDIQYEKLSDDFKSCVNNLSRWVKYYWFTNIDDADTDVQNPANHIKLIGNYSNDEPARLDLEVHRPHMNIYYKDIYYPQYYHFYPHINLRLPQWDQLKNSIYHWGWQPVCIHEKDAFITFDHFDYHFEAPVNNYYILAKDCSKNHKFLILAKTLEHSTVQKSLKMFILGAKIEILPLDASSPLVVRVDDVVKPMKQRSVFVWPDTDRPGKALFKIVKTGTQYIIESKKAGIEVIYNGNYIITAIANQYRGQACGMCGNADGEKYHEFVGPKGCVYNNEQAFGYSYVLPSSTFTLPDTVDINCVDPHEQYSGKCTLQRNIYANVYDAATKTSKVCFSTQAVPECGPNCRAANGKYLEKKIGFHCLPAQDGSTSSMINRINSLHPLPELENKSQDHFEVLKYPENCVRA